MIVTFTKVQGDWLEASFYEMVQLPDVEIPAYPGLFDAEGNQVQAAEPARTEPGALQRVEVAFISYHPTQLHLIVADAAKHGADLALHESMLAEWVAAYVPPEPVPEPVQIPQRVTAFQAKAALLHADLLDAVEAMMADTATPRIVKLAWVETLHFERTSPTVAAMAAALGLTDAEVDALFVYGAEVEA